MSKSNMTLKFDLIPGTTVEQAIDEAATKAWALDLAYVVFDFNGIRVSVRAKTETKWGVEQVERALKYNQTSVVL